MPSKPAAPRNAAAASARLGGTRGSVTLIVRQRLLDLLAAARTQRCVLLQGPAGSGKTSVLTTWRRELVGLGVEVAWAPLGEDDTDATHLFDVLLAALGGVDAAIVREASFVAGRGDDDAQALEHRVIALVHGMTRFGRALVLVVDDAHHLGDPRAWEALQLLLDYAPRQFQCAFASRTPVPLSLARLRAQEQVLEIGFDALRFTPAESARMLADRWGDAVDERRALALHAQTNGWAAGLALLGMDPRATRPGAASASTTAPAQHVQDAPAFARYLEQEVLSAMPGEQRDLLLCCALPPHFNAELCAALLADSAHASHQPGLLDTLVAQGLFLAPADPRLGEGWWRMHRLLRDALSARLHALPAQRLQALHATAWQWFAARGMHQEAVQHALQAGQAQAAADLVERSATALFVAGDWRSLVGMLRHLPQDIVRERTGLRLWMACVQVCEHRLDECGHSIAQLIVDMHSAAPGERYRLAILRGLYAVQRDDSAAAVALLPELRDVPPDADPVAVSGGRNLMTWIHLYSGDYERAWSLQLDRPVPLVDGKPVLGTPFGVLAGRCLLGLAHAVPGQMIQAERIYRDVLFEAERAGAACIDAACLAAGLLGEVLYELNDPAGALRLLEDRVDVLERVSIPDTVLRVMLALGRSRWLLGRPLDTFAHLDYVEDYAAQRGLDRLLAYSLLEQFQFRLRQNDPAAARLLLERIEVLYTRHAHAETGTLSEIRVVAERARIRMAMERGDLHAALAQLQSLTDLCQRRGRVRRVPFLHLQSAVAQRRLGHTTPSRVHVHEALRTGHRLGLVRTLLDAHEDVPLLLRDALETGELDPVLAFYAERLQAAARLAVDFHKAGGAPRTASASAAVQTLSPRESEIAQLLLQAMPNKKIARALDLSVDTVKWHLKNLYGKLGVASRDAVVERLRAAQHR